MTATPATQKRRSPKARQDVHPTPWQCTLSGKPRLPRQSGGAPRDARAYIRPLGSAHCPTPDTQKKRSPIRDARAYIRPFGNAHCPTPATQKRRSPKGRQGVHPTPWQCTLSHACHAKAAEPQGTPGRVYTSDPLAVHIVPRLPRKRGGAPRDARAYIRPLGSAHCPTPATQEWRSPKGRQGVHRTLWQCTLSHACHAKTAEPQGTPGRTSDPLAVHICPAEPQGTPGCTSDPMAVHIVPRLTRKRNGAPRDARAYIRPFGSAHCPTPATQKRRSPKGRQGVHRTLWQCTLSHACDAKAAEPQGVHQTPWQCTLSHACHAKEAEPQGTPERTSDPLAVHIVPRLPRKRGGAKGTPGRTSDPLAMHIVTRLPRKSGGAKGTPGRTSDPLAVHIVPRLPRKRGGAQGTPGRTPDPLAAHIVPRLPRKRGGAQGTPGPRDARE